MGFNEFKELFVALNGWKQNFMMFDQDRSGTVEPRELSQAINAMGESPTQTGSDKSQQAETENHWHIKAEPTSSSLQLKPELVCF